MSDLPPPPPAAPARKSPTGWIIGGVVLLVLSLGSWPRGLIGFIASIARPELGINPGYPLGVFAFGAVLVAAGVVLLVRGVRISKANKQAA